MRRPAGEERPIAIDTPRSAQRRSGAQCFAIFLALFAVLSAWSLASPLYSGPDEPAHVVRAASLVRGQLLGAPSGPADGPDTVVHVPEWLRDANAEPACFNGRVAIPASCERTLPTGGATIQEGTYTGRYPPLYSAIVGWPTLVTSGSVALRLMRLSGAAACAALLAGAGWCALRSRRRIGLLVGLSLSATPQVFFLGGVVNPSGLEISAAVCVWTAGLAVIESAATARGRPDRAALAWLTVAAVAMVNSRGLSPLLLGLITVILLAAAGRRRATSVLRSRAGRVSAAVIVVASLLAIAWVIGAGALRSLPTRHADHSIDLWHSVLATVDNVFSMAPQYLGVFGWVDTTLPVWLYVSGFAAGAGLIGLAVARADRHRRRVAVASAVLCLLVPVILTVSQTARLGVFGQARDWMPLWVGLPLLTCQALGRRVSTPPRRRLWLVAAVGSGAVAFQVLSWLRLVQRYRFGLGDQLSASLGTWNPPLPTPALLALLCVGLAGLAGTGIVAARVPRPSREGLRAAGVARDIDIRDGTLRVGADAGCEQGGPVAAAYVRESPG